MYCSLVLPVVMDFYIYAPGTICSGRNDSKLAYCGFVLRRCGWLKSYYFCLSDVKFTKEIPSCVQSCKRLQSENNNVLCENQKAGDGNRTHMTSLEGWGFTIKLHPRHNLLFVIYYLLFTIR